MRLDRERARKIIFESDTPEGRRFDVWLIGLIIASVLAIFADSLPAVHASLGPWLYGVEWLFALIFTVEYGFRLWSVEHPFRYAMSFFGIVDLLAFLPTYASPFLPGSQYLIAIRILRVLRVFRILKLTRFIGEANALIDALRASRRKIAVFLVTVMTLIVVAGSLMYLIEGPENGYTSIPASMYWAVVTVTTVGYGDISPHTPLGRILASALMITGYAIIAVPTGIFSVEYSDAVRRREAMHQCPNCSATGHVVHAAFCWRCGAQLYSGR